MAQITVSINEDLEAKLRDYADANGYATLSSLVSEAIREKLNGGAIGMPYWNRVNFCLQLRNNQLLETLAADKVLVENSEWPLSTLYDALSNGYEEEYSDIYNMVSQDELPRSISELVRNTLDAYRVLQWSVEGLEDASERHKLQDETLFPGFDGNNEHRMLGYVRHLVRDGRWTDVKTKDHGYNSHARMESYYRSLVQRYKEVRQRNDSEIHDYNPLSKTDILYILRGNEVD